LGRRPESKGERLMGCFSNMFKSGNSYKTWMVQVNLHGETVVHRLDEEGRPVDFTAGPARETLSPAMIAADPTLRMIFVASYQRGGLIAPHDYGFEDLNLWSSLVEILNGKSCAAKGKINAVRYAHQRFGLSTADYFYRAYGEKLYKVMPKGIEHDEWRASG
jgi:hypothetical protein